MKWVWPYFDRRLNLVPFNLNWSNSSFLSLSISSSYCFNIFPIQRDVNWWNNRIFDRMSWHASLKYENVSLSHVFGSYFHSNSNTSLSLNCICLSKRTTWCGWHLSPTCHHLIVYMIYVKKFALLIMLMTTNLDIEIWWVIQLWEKLSRKKKEIQSLARYFFHLAELILKSMCLY